MSAEREYAVDAAGQLSRGVVARVVGVGAIGLALTAPGQTIGVSFFIDPLVEDLGLARSSIASAYTFGTLVAAAVMTKAGSLIDRYGVQRSTIVIALAFGLAAAAIGAVQNWAMLLVAFIGLRVFGQGALQLAATTWVAKTVGHARSGAMAMTLGIGQVGMALIPIVLTAVSARAGWRGAALAGGVLVWLVVPLLAWWGMNRRRVGIPDDAVGHEGGAAPAVVSWTRREALRSGMFWVLAAGFAAGGSIHTALTFHHFSILGARGISPGVAAMVFLPSQVAMFVGILAVGSLSSRLSPRVLMPLSMGCLALASALLYWATSLSAIVVYGIAIGFGMGTAFAQEAAYMPRLFGPRHIGAIRGLTTALMIASTALSPLVVALLVESFGTFGVALLAFFVIPIIVGIAALFVRLPAAAPRSA